jgi:hypothetical protein
MTTGLMTADAREGYRRGLADGRRTAEAELEAERYAVATLANALGSAVTQLTLHLNPGDFACLGLDGFDICVQPDRHLPAGAVRLSGCAR